MCHWLNVVFLPSSIPCAALVIHLPSHLSQSTICKEEEKSKVWGDKEPPGSLGLESIWDGRALLKMINVMRKWMRSEFSFPGEECEVSIRALWELKGKVVVSQAALGLSSLWHKPGCSLNSMREQETVMWQEVQVVDLREDCWVEAEERRLARYWWSDA